jgi:Holliday junction resolvase RusA-like endonuclease
MTTIRFRVDGEPQPMAKRLPRKRGKGRDFPNDPTGKKKGWIQEVERVAIGLMEERGVDPFGEDDPIQLTVTAYRSRPISGKGKKMRYPLPRPDASNYAYPIENALSTVVYWDDSRVIRFIAEKYFADAEHPAGVEVTITRME